MNVNLLGIGALVLALSFTYSRLACATDPTIDGNTSRTNQSASEKPIDTSADEKAYASFASSRSLKEAARYLRAFPAGSYASDVSGWIRSQRGLFPIPKSDVLLALVSEQKILSISTPKMYGESRVATLTSDGGLVLLCQISSPNDAGGVKPCCL